MERILHIENRCCARGMADAGHRRGAGGLGGVVAFTTLQLRERIREQIAGRDGKCSTPWRVYATNRNGRMACQSPIRERSSASC
jgi:hypothetical protein